MSQRMIPTDPLLLIVDCMREYAILWQKETAGPGNFGEEQESAASGATAKATAKGFYHVPEHHRSTTTQASRI
jgi:hypothetical protein